MTTRLSPSAFAALVGAAVTLTACSPTEDTAAVGAGTAAPTASATATVQPLASPSPSPSPPAMPSAARPVVEGEVPVRSAAPELVERPVVDAPVSVEVGSLGIDMEVVDVGVTDRGTMELPDDSGTAGWYRYGPAPGDNAGNAVIAAHVDDPYGTGPFARLREVEAGAAVEIEAASGEVLTYVVTDVQQTDKSEVDVNTVFADAGTHALVMVTCGGRWNADIGHYADNVIVTALPRDPPGSDDVP